MLVATFWTDTVGLAFTFIILMPALATGLLVVAMISARGEKRADEQVRGKWGRKTAPGDDA